MGVRWFEAELHRLWGELLLSPSGHAANDDAESYFRRALAIGRDQSAKLWELRAAMSLARLWRGQGRRREAVNLLAPIYNWFTEGFETSDIKNAKALLNDLT